MSLKSRLRAEAMGALQGAAAAAPAFTALFFLFRDHLEIFRDHGASILLAMAVTYYPTLVVHELGHVLAGWLAISRFQRFMVGPLVITRRGGRPHLKWVPHTNWLSGRVLMLPRSATALSSRFIVMLLGGTLANFLVVAVAVLLDRARGPVENATDWGTITLIGGAAEALFLGILALIPHRAGIQRQPNDGWRLLVLLRARSAASRLTAAWVLVGYHTAGYRSRDCPDSLVRLAADNPILSRDGAIAVLFAYYWALDHGLAEDAARYLAEAATLRGFLADAVQAALHGERAFFLARYHRDPETAQAVLDTLPQGCPKVVAFRAQAAVHLAQDRLKAAIADAEEGLRILARDYAKNNVADESDWLCAIIADARERMALVATT